MRRGTCHTGTRRGGGAAAGAACWAAVGVAGGRGGSGRRRQRAQAKSSTIGRKGTKVEPATSAAVKASVLRGACGRKRREGNQRREEADSARDIFVVEAACVKSSRARWSGLKGLTGLTG